MHVFVCIFAWCVRMCVYVCAFVCARKRERLRGNLQPLPAIRSLSLPMEERGMTALKNHISIPPTTHSKTSPKGAARIPVIFFVLYPSVNWCSCEIYFPIHVQSHPWPLGVNYPLFGRNPSYWQQLADSHPMSQPRYASGRQLGLKCGELTSQESHWYDVQHDCSGRRPVIQPVIWLM